MKRYYLLALGLIMVLVAACTEEKDYYLNNIDNKNVNFKIVNVIASPADSAVSVKYRYSFYPDGYNDNVRTFSIKYYDYYNYVYYPEKTELETINVELEYDNELWAGGNNDIKILYTPSCQEEKSAQFTMPDATTVTLSRENNSYVWRLDSVSYNKARDRGYYDYLPIYAKSEFEKDGKKNINCGYVVLNLNYEGGYIVYDNQKNIWFRRMWW